MAVNLCGVILYLIKDVYLWGRLEVITMGQLVILVLNLNLLLQCFPRSLSLLANSRTHSIARSRLTGLSLGLVR
jgi:hypothetical protein